MADMRNSREIIDDEYDVVCNQPIARECLSAGCQLDYRDAVIERLRETLRMAWVELNAIRARDGAPFCITWGEDGLRISYQVSRKYFGWLVDECEDAIQGAPQQEKPANG